MTVDLGLDRGGAGHRRLGANQRGRGTQREAGDVPERLERGRPNAAFGHHPIEDDAVARFLARHAGDLARLTRGLAHHRQLPGIDSRRAIFAGLVDPEHGCAMSRVGHVRLHKAMMPSPPRIEMSALKPASDMPKRVHCAMSH